MKHFRLISILSAVGTLLSACIFGKSKTIDPMKIHNAPSSLYSIALTSIDGITPIKLASFKGKKILFVNTASKCGYTPQYKELQELHEKMGDKLVIIGCPCNQFMDQEPGDKKEILAFCTMNYGITFQLSEKLDVKGSKQHPLFTWLCNRSQNGSMDASVSWNFNKFLVNEEGYLVGYFPSGTKPLSEEMIAAINK